MSRLISAGLAGVPGEVDLVVVGLGATGAGTALDAVTRGLTVLAVDAHDLAFGTSRWSSKLVHGGLRYLAQGQFRVAHESAVERGLLMEVTAPHLTRAMPWVLPLSTGVSHRHAAMMTSGIFAGDLLRLSAHTPRATLPRPRRISATETLQHAPGLRSAGLRGGLLSWDGQLEDDARLVTTIARTAARHGAHIRTRSRVLHATGTRVTLRDELTGRERTVSARGVVNATGVWAGGLVPEVTLRPSRGSHLVLRPGSLPGLRAIVTVPVPGSVNRFVMVLPQPDGTHFVGLTDEPADGPIPDVPVPTDAEVDFLLGSVADAFDRPLGRADVAGVYAGLRPLLATGDGATADLSRSHTVLASSTGVVTVVGGKLTTYRRMAEDAVDAVLARTTLTADPCRTRTVPLDGAARRPVLAAHPGPKRLVRRYGMDADLVLATARDVTGLGDDELLAPVATGVPTNLAELVFGATHEGAVDVGDLLDRRTRVGLVPADRERAVGAAERALALAGRMRVPGAR